MSLRHRLAQEALTRDTILTIGVFDGVHRGHCHLLRRLTESAYPQYTPAVITFFNHPSTVLRPGSLVSYLTTPQQKARLLKAQGIERVVSLEFTRELSQISARDFTLTLVELMRMKGLVVGPDFALGHNREGNTDFLRRLGAELDFWVEMAEPLELDGALVRSRRIREAIGRGAVDLASRLLGRDFYLEGSVSRGLGRGQELGFPTANLAVPEHMMIPGDGIYSTWAIVDGTRHPSATSIGVRPTFGLSERLIEIHIMDFDANLYGREMGVEFVSKLRDQETFSSVTSLLDQIHRDIADARLALAHAGGSNVA